MAMRGAGLVMAVVAQLAAGMALAGLPAAEPGAMLREGNWDGEVGTYEVPASFSTLKPSAWPGDGWLRLTFHRDRVERARVHAAAREMPGFLRSITARVERAQSQPIFAPNGPEPEGPGPLYVRVPGVSPPEGSAPLHLFRNGTSGMRPILDRKYDLSLAGVAFSFTARNGLRGKNGAPYGDGAQYTIEYGGNTYEYSLDGFGWNSAISAIADFDGDGKPDFLVTVGGNNTSAEYLLLSSQAKPGHNPATASLHAMGC